MENKETYRKPVLAALKLSNEVSALNGDGMSVCSNMKGCGRIETPERKQHMLMARSPRMGMQVQQQWPSISPPSHS